MPPLWALLLGRFLKDGMISQQYFSQSDTSEVNQFGAFFTHLYADLASHGYVVPALFVFLFRVFFALCVQFYDVIFI